MNRSTLDCYVNWKSIKTGQNLKLTNYYTNYAVERCRFIALSIKLATVVLERESAFQLELAKIPQCLISIWYNLKTDVPKSY